MSLLSSPKIDCHNHVLDPARFPYADDASYKPAGQEIATAATTVVGTADRLTRLVKGFRV